MISESSVMNLKIWYPKSEHPKFKKNRRRRATAVYEESDAFYSLTER